MGRKSSVLFHKVSFLYWKLCRKFGHNDRDDFRVVSGILRLATKYLFEVLRSAALAHLSTAWPPTLKGWESREDLMQTYELNHPHKPRLFPHPFVSYVYVNCFRSRFVKHLTVNYQPCKGNRSTPTIARLIL